MKICVIGAGAMGSLFGALLYEAGHQVGLVAARPAYMDAVRRNHGIVLEQGNNSRVVPCPLSLDAMDFANSDLCLVFVKSTATSHIASAAAACLNEKGCILTLQNGIGNADILAQHITPKRILTGYTTHGALLLEAGVVRHTGAGNTSLGPWQKGGLAEELAPQLAKVFTKAGITTQILDDARAAIWDKLFVNIGINAIGALLNITNGQVGQHPDSAALASRAMEEAKKVAQAQGIKVRDDLFANFQSVCQLTAQNRCSMWQDLQKKRLTEVDFIHGAISRMGAELGILTPINDVLASLVRIAQFYNLEGDEQ